MSGKLIATKKQVKPSFVLRLVLTIGVTITIIMVSLIIYMMLQANRGDIVVARSIERYPGSAKWNMETCSGLDQGRCAYIDFDTPDDSGKVINFYKDKFAKNGWILDFQQANDSEYNKTTQLKFKKQIGDSSYTADLTISREFGGARIIITHTD